MTNTTMDSQSYPQFSQATATDNVGPVSKLQMNNYRVHPAIQNRPHKMIALEKEEHGIVLTFSTSGRKAVLSYTHETALYLYQPSDFTVNTLYLHIHLSSNLLVMLSMPTIWFVILEWMLFVIIFSTKCLLLLTAL